ncbi:unnamed protein product [Bathycoccus prasinos]
MLVLFRYSLFASAPILFTPYLASANWPVARYTNGTVGLINDGGEVHVQSEKLQVNGHLKVEGNFILNSSNVALELTNLKPPKCLPPGGDKLQFDGTYWICICYALYSGPTCEIKGQPIPLTDTDEFRHAKEACLEESPLDGMCQNFGAISGFGVIPDWDTGKVTSMVRVFYNYRWFNGNITSWNVSSDIGSWNTEKVTIMSGMFYYASAFNQDIGNWNTAQVTDMESMFYQASAFDQDISSWTGTAATTAQTHMFLDASAFQAKFACTNAVNGPASSCDTIKSTWVAPPPPPPPADLDYSYLGEGECRQSDGSYPIKFSKGYSDLSPHTSGTNAQQAMDRCKAKCIEFAWCLAAEVVLRDIWPTPECRFITDWNAYVVESTNTFQNNQWGGTQSIDGENYQTYCNGGSSPCDSSNAFDGGKLYSRDGYHCYLKTAT